MRYRYAAESNTAPERQARQILKDLGLQKLGALAHTVFDAEFYETVGSYSMPHAFSSLFEQYTSPGPLDGLDDEEFFVIAELAFDYLAGKLVDALVFEEG
jgi:hypothetical protein